jgi:aspartate/methionine/tyrosine aminotransferase
MKTVEFSERTRSIVTAKSMDIAEKAKSLVRAGEDVIDFSWGEPDFDTPLRVKEACKKALDSNLTHYSASRGVDVLRKAVCDKVKKDQGVEYSWADNIIVTPGAKQAIFYSLFALLNKGDEVLVPEPYWLSYKDAIELAGGKLKAMACSSKDGFRLKPEDVERNITPRTKVLLLNNPCNPTGVSLNSAELEQIAKVLKGSGITVISDEIYSALLYDGRKFVSFAAMSGMFDRTITVNGFSKAYAMTGWRLGYLLAPKHYIDEINKIHQHIATCAGTFIQYAAEDAVRHCDDDAKKMCGEYQKRRDLIVRLIGDMETVSCLKPDGTFYLWVDIRRTGYGSMAFCDMLLDKMRIASVPGVAYGESGEGYVRFAFTQPESRIIEGIKRMKGSFR